MVNMHLNLEAFNQITQKSDGWLQPDFSVVKSGWLGRLFWVLVGKRFVFTQKYFYGLDLKATQLNLSLQ